MNDMEAMVEFMKTEVPNWDMQTLQARACAFLATCLAHSLCADLDWLCLSNVLR